MFSQVAKTPSLPLPRAELEDRGAAANAGPGSHFSLSSGVQDLKEPVAALLQRLGSLLSQTDLGESERDQLTSIANQATAMSDRIDQLTYRDSGTPPVAPAERDAIEETGDRGRFTVLVVDDDAVQRDGLRQLLDPYFTTLAAADGTEGARLVREYLPDLVISDLCMPEADGFALLSSVRFDEETAHIPLLVLSGLTETDAKVRAFEAGAFDYLTKPVVAGELIARVRNALARGLALRRERLLQATDDLTGLANRRWLRSFLASAVKSAARNRTELSVVMVDEDGLKQVNDRFGHAAGDEAIRTMSRALTKSKRAGDCAARVGGDEFVIAMPGTDRTGAQAFIARVEQELRREPLRGSGELKLHVSASFGVATCSELMWAEDAEQLLERADQALYEAKRTRKRPVG